MLNAVGFLACTVLLYQWPTLKRWDLEWLWFGILCLLAVLSLPIAWWVMLPQLDYVPTTSDVIQSCFTIGINSFLWGYGAAWLTKRRAHHPGLASPGNDNIARQEP